MWELDYKENWVPKTWCFWTIALENTLETPLDCKEIQPVHPKGDQSWVFIGRTNVEVATPILWPPDVKSWLMKSPWCQGCILSPCLFNIYAEYIMRNAGLDKAQAGIKIARRNINNLRYADGRKWRGTIKPLDESEGGEWKSWLKKLA